MRTFYLAALLLAASIVSPGCLSPGDVSSSTDSDTAKVATLVADAVLTKIAPFISTDSARQAAHDAAEAVLAKRREEGKDESAPLNAEEWALIAGAIVAGLAGLNKYRNVTRKKVLDTPH